MANDGGLPPPQAGTARALMGVIVLVLLVLAGFGMWHVLTQRRVVGDAREARSLLVAAGQPVEVTQVSRHSGPRRVTLPGDVRAFRQVTLYAKVSGYLEKVLVDKGDAVRAEQLLAVVKSPESDQAVNALTASLQAKQQLVNRYQDLVKKGVVSAQEMDRATADLASSQAELARITALRDYEIIRAPFGGIVTARYVDPGALVAAAAGGTAQPLLDVADMRRVRIYVYVGQAEAPFIHEGDPVTLGGDEATPALLQARVTRLARTLDVRTRTMLVEVDLDNRGGALVPGVFVQVTLQVQTPQGITVPSQALVLKNGVYQVARIDADRRAHFVAVEVGRDDGQSAHIVSGLSDGDWVGINLGDSVTDGAKVQPMADGKPVLPVHGAAP